MSLIINNQHDKDSNNSMSYYNIACKFLNDTGRGYYYIAKSWKQITIKHIIFDSLQDTGLQLFSNFFVKILGYYPSNIISNISKKDTASKESFELTNEDSEGSGDYLDGGAKASHIHNTNCNHKEIYCIPSNYLKIKKTTLLDNPIVKLDDSNQREVGDKDNGCNHGFIEEFTMHVAIKSLATMVFPVFFSLTDGMCEEYNDGLLKGGSDNALGWCSSLSYINNSYMMKLLDESFKFAAINPLEGFYAGETLNIIFSSQDYIKSFIDDGCFNHECLEPEARKYMKSYEKHMERADALLHLFHSHGAYQNLQTLVGKFLYYGVYEVGFRTLLYQNTDQYEDKTSILSDISSLYNSIFGNKNSAMDYVDNNQYCDEELSYDNYQLYKVETNITTDYFEDY